MDFHNMKRKQLQALCKKHGIPANKTNLEMATLLASTLKVSESGNVVSEIEEEEESVVVSSDNNEKKSKKVRFSPDVETREYEPSVYKGKGGRKREVVDEEVVAKKRRVRNLGGNNEEKAVVGQEKSEKVVSLEIDTLLGLKRKELQSLCKKHGIPANKTNLQMARLLAATLKVSQQTGSSASQTHGDIERMEQLNEKEPLGDNEAGNVEVLRACDNEEGVDNIGELIGEGNVILRGESILAAEDAFTESISLVKEPVQDAKLRTPEVTKSVKMTKEYKSRSNRKIRDLGDGLDELSDNAQCVEENQNLTPVFDELLRSQTKIINCSSPNQPGFTGLEKGMEVEEMSGGKDSQHENRDFNDHSSENDCSIQVESDVHPSLDDIEAQVDSNLEVGQNESGALVRTLDAEKILCTVQETKDNERDIGLFLPSNNNDLEQVELSDEKEGNNASSKGAYEEALHSQSFGDCSTEIREESKDILDGGNHNDCETISKLDIPEDISKDLTDQKEKRDLESDGSVDAAQLMEVISIEDVNVDSCVVELTEQDKDLGCAIQVEIGGGNGYKEVLPHTHSEGEPSFNQTSCDGFEGLRMEIIDAAVTPDAEVPTKTPNSESVGLQDANDSGNKEMASYLNKNSDESVSQNILDKSKFFEEWSVEKLEKKETEFEFASSQVSDFTQSIHDNMAEGEPAEKHGHCEDIYEISGEAIENGTHTESPKSLRTQQTPSESSSSPFMLGLLFPDEREEFTEIRNAAPEILIESLSEDSKDPIGTSQTVNDSLEVNSEKSGQLDNFMKKNSIEVNEDMFVDSENVTSAIIKPEDAMETVKNIDELAKELTTPLALTSSTKQAAQNKEEIPVYSESCGKSEKKSIDTFSELKDLPFYDTAELQNESSDVDAPALVGGNAKYNDEKPTTDALQEIRWSKDYVPVMTMTENVTDLERVETIVVEKKLGNASPTDRNETINAGDKILNALYNVSAIKKELTEQVRDNIKNVEIEHSYAIEGMSMEASAGAIVADKLNSFPAVESIDTNGAIDASNEKHDTANQLSEIDDVVNERFVWSDINFLTLSKVTSEDKNKGCVMATNEAPLHKPNVEDSAASQNKETMDVEGFVVNASHYDREQEVETPATEAQQLSLLNKDVMEIQENSKMNTQTAGALEVEDQHGENVYTNMKDNPPLKFDEIQGSCSPEIQEESAETKKDNFSGRLGVNEQFLSEDVQPDSSELDQSISCINAVSQEEDGVVEAKMRSDHDASESLHIDESKQYDLPLKGVQIQGSCSPETDEDKNVKAQNYPVNSENNEIAGLGDVSTETLLSEHARELPSLARNRSISPLNATVVQGTGDEKKVESELKLASVETTSLIVKEEEQRSAIAKQLISPALKSKHRRTVLIHGTPKRVFESSEMKENIHSTKMQQAGHLTAQRALPKRRPLEDLRKI